MTDRERIAEIKDELMGLLYKTLKSDDNIPVGNRAYTADILSWAIADAGYTRQPEPAPERVEALADAYYDFTVKQGWKLAGFETEIRTASYEFAREIRKLFPVEPEDAQQVAIARSNAVGLGLVD